MAYSAICDDYTNFDIGNSMLKVFVFLAVIEHLNSTIHQNKSELNHNMAE